MNMKKEAYTETNSPESGEVIYGSSVFDGPDAMLDDWAAQAREQEAEVAGCIEELPPQECLMGETDTLPKEENVKAPLVTATPMKDNRPRLEDFLKTVNSEKTFMESWLYRGIYKIKENDITRFNNVDFLLQAKAKEIGGATVVKLYKDQRKAFFTKLDEEKKLAIPKPLAVYGTVEGITNYTNLPEGVMNLDCGSNWIATDDGIYINDGKYPRLVCRQPITITGILKSMNTGAEKVKLEFLDWGEWKELVVDKDILASAQKITALYKLGLSVTSNNAREVVAFLQDLLDYSKRKNLIPITLTTEKMGWNEEKDGFIPYTVKDIQYEQTGILSGLWEVLQPQGDRGKWYKTFEKVRGIPMMDFIAAANFSAPLVGLLGLEGFVADIFGPSRGGKSVSNNIGCSFWANPGLNGHFMFGVENTVNSIEGILYVLSSLPFIMEDANNMSEKKQKDLQTIIMKICNGVGKARMNRDMTLRPILTWKTVGIVTSENRITKDFHNNGSINRVLLLRGANPEDCPYQKDGLSVSELKEVFENNYGFAGKDFIEALLEIGREKLNARLKEIRKEVEEKAKKLGKSAGQTLPVAVMLLADEIAEEHLFRDGKRISVEDAVKWMSAVDEADQNQRFYERLEDTVIQNSGRFEGLGMTECTNNSQYWGKYMKKTGKVAIMRIVLKNMADEENLDLKLFLEDLDRKGLLEKDSKGNYTKPVHSSILNKENRMYVITLPMEEAEFVQASEMDREVPFEDGNKTE